MRYHREGLSRLFAFLRPLAPSTIRVRNVGGTVGESPLHERARGGKVGESLEPGGKDESLKVWTARRDGMAP